MPTRYTVEWTKNIEVLASTALTNGSNRTDDFDFDTADYLGAVFQFILDANTGSPAGNVTIEIFRSINGTSDIDTIAAQTFTVPFAGTSTKKVSIPIYDASFVRFKTTNNVGQTINVSIKAAGRKEIGTAF